MHLHPVTRDVSHALFAWGLHTSVRGQPVHNPCYGVCVCGDLFRKELPLRGFNRKKANLIYKCVSTASFQVLMNGSPKASFKSSRGIRQEDPLSPYLFVLCARRLSVGLMKVEEDQIIKSTKICRSSPSVSHLPFAYNCYIFCKQCLLKGGL